MDVDGPIEERAQRFPLKKAALGEIQGSQSHRAKGPKEFGLMPAGLPKEKPQSLINGTPLTRVV